MIPILETTKIWTSFFHYASGQAEKSHIEKYTIEEIKVTMSVFSKDNAQPGYKALEVRLAELQEIERHAKGK